MRYVRAILWVVLGAAMLAFLLIAAAITTVNTLDWNNSKYFTKQDLEDGSGYEISQIEGVAIHVGRSLSLSIDALTLHARDQNSQALDSLSIEGAKVQLALMPLLLKQMFIVETIDVKREKVSIRGVEPQKPIEPWIISRFLEHLPSMLIESASIQNVDLAYLTVNKQSQLHLHLDEFVIAPENRRGKIILRSKGAIETLPFTAEGWWETRQVFEERKVPFPLRIQMSMNNALKFSVDGQIDRDRQSSHFLLEGDANDPSRFFQAIGLKMSGLPKMSLRFNIDQTPQMIEASKLNFSLGNTQFDGVWSIALKQPTPKFKGEFHSPLIHLQDIRGFFPVAASKPGQPNTKGWFSRSRFPVDFMRNFEAEIRFHVPPQKTMQSELTVSDLNMLIVLKEKKLALNPLSFAIANGRVIGQLAATMIKEPLTLDLKLGIRNLQLETALRSFNKDLPLFELRPSELVKGRLIGEVELNSQGSSMHDLASNADGKIQFAVEGGQISKVASEAFGFNLVGTVASLFKDRPFTDIQCMISSFTGKEGIFTNQAFIISTPDANISGHGTVDLVKEWVDMTFDSTPRKTIIGAAIAPIRVTGSFNNIAIELGDKSDRSPNSEGKQNKDLGQKIADILPFVEPGFEKEGACRRHLSILAEIRRESKSKSKAAKGFPGSESVGR